MKTKNILFYLLLVIVQLRGQTISKDYSKFINQTDSLLKLNEYYKAGLSFSSAFKTLGYKGKIEDRYKAARVWSLANIPDSAFYCLQVIIFKKYFNDYERLTTEKDFYNLKADNRWNRLIDTLNSSKKFVDVNFNGNHTLYRSDRQISKHGIFKEGVLHDGIKYIYTLDNKLERINIYKDGKFRRDSIVH